MQLIHDKPSNLLLTETRGGAYLTVRIRRVHRERFDYITKPLIKSKNEMISFFERFTSTFYDNGPQYVTFPRSLWVV